MAIIDKLKAIGDAIRTKTGKTELVQLSDIPAQIEDVFDKGRQDNRNSFWDTYQNRGNRTDYYAGFAGAGWTANSFNPKYNIKPTGSAYGMFQKSRIAVDLVEFAEKQGIEIEFSNATDLQYAFSNTSFSRIGVVDASNVKNLIRGFELSSSLKIIDKIILNSNGSTSLANAFNKCSALEEVRFEGIIGVNEVNFSACKLLSRDSLISIVTALSDRSGESSAYTCTLGEINLARLTAEEIKTATDKGWTLL